MLSGQIPLQLTFSAAATNLPLGRADLFLDGAFLQTVTNLPPSAGNILSVTLNGIPVSYTVPANATLAPAVTGLAAALNAQTNFTGVLACPIGDRLELQSLDVAVPGTNVTLSAASAIGSAAQLTTALTPARDTFLDTTATGYLGLLVSNAPAVGDWLELDVTKTNGTPAIISVTNTVPGTTIGALAQALFNLVNANPALQGADGVLASDFYDNADYCSLQFAQFNLYARSPGWPSAQIQVTLTSSTNLLALPSGANPLEDNLFDLRPRNDLYVTEGVTNLSLAFTLDTTTLPNGFHELTVVAYEGSHVRTQEQSAQPIQIQNGPLAATFATLVGGSNSAVEATLRFSVTANTNTIASIELFSTGGSLGTISNTASAVFSVAGTNLDLGLHPFYAIVTASNGQQYRTETEWIRLVAPTTHFLSPSPPRRQFFPGPRLPDAATTSSAPRPLPMLSS